MVPEGLCSVCIGLQKAEHAFISPLGRGVCYLRSSHDRFLKDKSEVCVTVAVNDLCFMCLIHLWCDGLVLRKERNTSDSWSHTGGWDGGGGVREETQVHQHMRAHKHTQTHRALWENWAF